jgi:hypothetical protein
MDTGNGIELSDNANLTVPASQSSRAASTGESSRDAANHGQITPLTTYGSSQETQTIEQIHSQSRIFDDQHGELYGPGSSRDDVEGNHGDHPPPPVVVRVSRDGDRSVKYAS